MSCSAPKKYKVRVQSYTDVSRGTRLSIILIRRISWQNGPTPATCVYFHAQISARTYVLTPLGHRRWEKKSGAESQKAAVCVCVWERERERERESALRWSGLAWQPYWHAGGVPPPLNAAVFCSHPPEKQVPLSEWGQIKPAPQSTDGAVLNNDSSAPIPSFPKPNKHLFLGELVIPSSKLELLELIMSSGENVWAVSVPWQLTLKYPEHLRRLRFLYLPAGSFCWEAA